MGCLRRVPGSRIQVAIGEELLYCVKAAGYAGGSVASGRACGLRPVPLSATPIHATDWAPRERGYWEAEEVAP